MTVERKMNLTCIEPLCGHHGERNRLELQAFIDAIKRRTSQPDLSRFSGFRVGYDSGYEGHCLFGEYLESEEEAIQRQQEESAAQAKKDAKEQIESLAKQHGLDVRIYEK